MHVFLLVGGKLFIWCSLPGRISGRKPLLLSEKKLVDMPRHARKRVKRIKCFSLSTKLLKKVLLQSSLYAILVQLWHDSDEGKDYYRNENRKA